MTQDIIEGSRDVVYKQIHGTWLIKSRRHSQEDGCKHVDKAKDNLKI